MAAHSVGADASSLAAPDAAERSHKDQALGVTAEGLQGTGKANTADCADAPRAGQALRVLEGKSKAAQYLSRLQAQQADPDELALIVSMLYGATLRGFSRVIQKALGVQHG